MSTLPIIKLLETGNCPVCGDEIMNDDMITRYFCRSDPTHFDLKLYFGKGDELSATLNDYHIPQHELRMINW